MADANPQQQFFRYFQHEATDLQQQFERLETVGLSHERADAIDHCLAGIARLSQEVTDASSYLPAYDQRTYSGAINALSSKLEETRSRVAPKTKFAFKTKKNASAISLQDAAEMAARQNKGRPGYPGTPNYSSNESSVAPTPAILRTPPNEVNTSEQHQLRRPDQAIARPNTTALNDGNEELQRPTVLGAGDQGGIRQPSFSQSSSIRIFSRKNQHIILPSSASHATTSGTLSNLRNCIVDMSSPTTTGAATNDNDGGAGHLGRRAFATLTIKNVWNSLLIAGHVNGPCHVTGLHSSVIVVAAQQVRLHDCTDISVYLLCTSRPIIEGCSDVRFAPMPDAYLRDGERGGQMQNHYDQVDDFNHPSAGAAEHGSPNWRVLREEERVEERVWKETVPGKPGMGVEDVLRAVGVGVRRDGE